MKRLRIMKSYAVLWLFIYFLVYSNIDTIQVFFFATLTFNLAVLTILTIGIIMLLKASTSLVMLAGTFGTLAYKKDNLLFYLKGIDKIMPANIAHMFNSRAEKGVMLFTAEESRDVIDWIQDKFFYQNRYTNYFIGTSLMIGLLGTFTGLLVAIDDMGRIILSLSGDIDLGKVISDFSGPLGGMAVGFGSSLFGVVAAIILGIKGYILNKNQEILIEGVEDWLKGRIINVGSSTPAVGTEMQGGQLPNQQHSFMDVFIEQISAMNTQMASIATTNERLHSITIASVQQARNEHELSIMIMENMRDSLRSIDSNAKESTQTLKQNFVDLSENMKNEQGETMKVYHKNLETLFTRLETSLHSAQSSISSEFAKITKDNAQHTTQHIDKVSSVLSTINANLEQDKSTLTQLLNSSNHAAKNQDVRLQEVSKILHSSAQTLIQEKELLNTLNQQIQSNANTNSQQMKNIIISLSNVGESISLEVQQLVNMEDLQKAQSSSINKSQDLLAEMKQTLEQSQTQQSSSLVQLKGINKELNTFNTDTSKLQTQETKNISEQIQNLREVIKTGQEQQDQALTQQSLQNDISLKGNTLLQEILGDQKVQMKTLVKAQEEMLIEQKNLSVLSQEGLATGNERLESIQASAKESLKEQKGFSEEHRMLLTLTQRSSELSEEAAGMNLDKSSDNLEALERLIQENQKIKNEITTLGTIIKKKSFGNGSDGFISKLFK